MSGGPRQRLGKTQAKTYDFPLGHQSESHLGCQSASAEARWLVLGVGDANMQTPSLQRGLTV